MRVKICGITSYEDAMSAIDAGADALGFVFYPPSPRHITPEAAAAIIRRLPPFVEKVGLFVNEEAPAINAAARTSGITLAQIHFDAPDALFDALECPYVRVIRAQSPEDVNAHADEYRLVDAYCDAYGGMGKRLNLEWFEGADCSKIILAGGLSPDNVEECLPYGFYALDVSSGVEASKGKKDPQKVGLFIAKAKA
ncbi:phosphoribosylanthranilate isomerase [Sulfurimonas sp. HSL1-6]|uniref:phosphoribosylanthranilate isomerase n=1 Tax=Thiomicrolovo immobilis TaxID=3131935 RepID=UPI0031F7D98E